MLGHRELIFEDYFDIVRRRRWLILLPIAIVPLLALVTMRIVPARYISTALVLIDQKQVPDEYVKAVVNDDLNQRVVSLSQQIYSRTRLQPIIERYQLYPNNGPGMDEKLDLMRKAILVKPIKSDMLRTQGLPGFTISYTSDQALVAQQVCSELTSLFVSENLRARASAVQGTTDFIRSQLDDAKLSLDQQEAKLAAFERQHFGEMPEQEQSNVAMMTTLTTQLDATTQTISQLQQNRLYLEAMLAQSAQPGTGAADQSSASPQEMDADLRKSMAAEAELEARYTPDHPDVVKLKRDIEIQKKRIQEAEKPLAVNPGGKPAVKISRTDSVPLAQMKAQLQSVNRAMEDKKQEQERIRERIAGYQTRIQSSPLVQEQMKALTRDHDTALKNYNDLLIKKNHSEMAGDLEKKQQGEQFRVMDAANLPDKPAFPDAKLFLGGGLIGGIALGITLATFFEYRDRSLRNERDVFAFTKLPTLATVPLMASAPHGVSKLWFPMSRNKAEQEVQR